jgi:hypothetical protein
VEKPESFTYNNSLALAPTEVNMELMATYTQPQPDYSSSSSSSSLSAPATNRFDNAAAANFKVYKWGEFLDPNAFRDMGGGDLSWRANPSQGAPVLAQYPPQNAHFNFTFGPGDMSTSSNSTFNTGTAFDYVQQPPILGHQVTGHAPAYYHDPLPPPNLSSITGSAHSRPEHLIGYGNDGLPAVAVNYPHNEGLFNQGTTDTFDFAALDGGVQPTPHAHLTSDGIGITALTSGLDHIHVGDVNQVTGSDREPTDTASFHLPPDVSVVAGLEVILHDDIYVPVTSSYNYNLLNEWPLLAIFKRYAEQSPAIPEELRDHYDGLVLRWLKFELDNGLEDEDVSYHCGLL